VDHHHIRGPDFRFHVRHNVTGVFDGRTELSGRIRQHELPTAHHDEL